MRVDTTKVFLFGSPGPRAGEEISFLTKPACVGIVIQTRIFMTASRKLAHRIRRIPRGTGAGARLRAAGQCALVDVIVDAI